MIADVSSRTTRGPTVLDLIALGVGYALAAAFIRSFWPESTAPRTLEAVLLAGDFCWLGLAMSGPFVLLFARREHDDTLGSKRFRYTRAECAWVVIGAYWIILTAVVVPTRLARSASATLTVLPLAFLAVLWVLRANSATAVALPNSWTNRAAVVMLGTWPLAWGAMIALVRSWP